MPPRRGISARKVILKIHLYLGIAAAVVLVIISLTGAVMAWEHDIERWTHPGLWYANTARTALPESEVIRIAERAFAPARVTGVQIDRRLNVVHVLQMNDKASVYVSPWDGTIHGRIVGASRTQRLIGYIHQLHLRLVPDPASVPRNLSEIGKLVVSFAGLFLCFLVLTGWILWWRTRRVPVRWSGSWFRIAFDAHRTIGIYVSLLLLIAGFTGIMVGFDFAEEQLYAITRSEHPKRPPPPSSSDVAGRSPISVDQAIASAVAAFPGDGVAQVRLPPTTRDSYIAFVRTPNDPSLDGPILTNVYVDQYSGQVIRVDNFLGESPGYRMVRLNRAIHTGDFLGVFGHVLMSFTSLMLGVMVVSGLVIWLKKLAI
jgi:uncharacterized iron-regulated membrane protein